MRDVESAAGSRVAIVDRLGGPWLTAWVRSLGGVPGWLWREALVTNVRRGGLAAAAAATADFVADPFDNIQWFDPAYRHAC